MAMPALDKIRSAYPDYTITAIVSPRLEEFFSRNTHVNETIVFDKSWGIKQKIEFIFSLRGKYYTIFDLKNSFLPFLLNVKRRTSVWRNKWKNGHSKDFFLNLCNELIGDKGCSQPPVKSDFKITDKERGKWGKYSLGSTIFIAGSSLASSKQYPSPRLKEVLEILSRKGYPLAILGQSRDRDFYGNILGMPGIIDLVGKTLISDVFYLFKNYGQLLICVDSGLLHLGSYLDIPIVALFGPTDAVKYGPWSQRNIILQNNITRRMEDIPAQEVIAAVSKMLDNKIPMD